MTMDADQLHPPSGDGPVATADGPETLPVDNVMRVLQTSPFLKKLPAHKNELLHAFFRDDSLARTKGEPIAMWLVRYNEQLGKLKRGGLDIVTSLPDIAGWQALNLAGLTEDRIERVVSGLPDAERACLFNSRDSSPGGAWSSNERERERVQRNARPHHRWDSPDPHLRQKEHKITLLRPHSGTRVRKLSILRTRTMTAATQLIRAICWNTCQITRGVGHLHGQW